MGITQEDRPERTNITATAPGMAEITEFLAREFPQNKCRVLAVGAGGATVAHEVGTGRTAPRRNGIRTGIDDRRGRGLVRRAAR